MRRWSGYLAACLLATGCSAPDDEAELRELLAAAEAAAEDRDTGFFRGLIADAYVDGSGRRKDELIDLVRGVFLVNSRIDVITRVESITLVATDVADVVVQAAMIGNSGRSGALGVDAEFYEFELELVRDGSDWQIIGAAWEPVLGSR